MARKAIVLKTFKHLKKAEQAVKNGKKPKFSSRLYHRCQLCGRSRGYMGFFGMCRICVREKAANGELVGVKKASW